MRYILIALSFGLALNSAAQTSYAGFYIGANYSNYRGENLESDMKLGWQAGGLYNFPLCGNFALQPELNVMSVGAKYDIGGSDDLKWNLLYANLPITAQYHTKSGVYFEAGPQVSYLLSAKYKYDDESIDIKDSFCPFDMGINLGIGYRVRDNIRVGVRYMHGLTDIEKSPGGSLKNYGFALNTRVLFPM